MIDKQEFDEFYQFYNDNMVVEIIDLFLDEYPGRVIALKENILAKNFGKTDGHIGFIAHKLKGLMVYLYDPIPIEYAEAIIDLDDKGISEGMMELYDKLVPAVDDLVLQVKEIRTKLTS